MNQLSTLYFPETAVEPETLAGLLAFFSSVFYYLPAEAAGRDAAAADHENRLSCGYPPVPLGDDLERFNRTLKDISVNLNDYGERLRALSLVSLSPGRNLDKDELSAGALVTALSREAEGKRDHLVKERLWRARLVLQLAEDLEQKEEETNRSLEQIEDLEQRLFASLQGLEENPIARSDSRRSPGPLMLEQRLRAWAELYIVDQRPDRPWLLSTGRPEAAAPLFAAYEKLFQQEPLLLFSIMLPVFPAAPGPETNDPDFINQRQQFQKSATGMISTLSGNIKDLAAGRVTGRALDEKLTLLGRTAAAWDEMVGGRLHGSRLTFHCLPGISPDDLFMRAFGLEKPATGRRPLLPNTMLAVLSN